VNALLTFWGSTIGKQIVMAVTGLIGVGFHCTFYGECQEACPKLISIDTIVRMNRDYLRATLTTVPEARADGSG